MKDHWILVLSVGKRKETALKVQEILTDYGCYIKTRIGLHDEGCANSGLIVLELIGDKNKRSELEKTLLTVSDVKTKLVTFS